MRVIVPNMAELDCLESRFKENKIALSDCHIVTQIKSLEEAIEYALIR